MKNSENGQFTEEQKRLAKDIVRRKIQKLRGLDDTEYIRDGVVTEEEE